MHYDIRNMEIGEVLDLGIAVMKDNFRLLVGICLLTHFPLVLAQGLVQLWLFPELAGQPQPEEVFQTMQDRTNSLVIVLVHACATAILLPLFTSVITDIVAKRLLGHEVGVVESLKTVFSRTLSIWWTIFLYGLSVAGGSLLCGIPGILCYFWFALAVPTLIVEGSSSIRAMERSRHLMKGSILRFFVLLLLLGAVGIGINVMAAIIPEVHLQMVAVAFGSSLNVMFNATVLVVFYYSCRCRRDDFDVQWLVGRAIAAPMAGVAIDAK